MSRGQLLRFLLIQEAVLVVLGFLFARWWGIDLWQGWSMAGPAWTMILAGTGVLLAVNGLIWWTSEAVRHGLRQLFNDVLEPLKPRDFLVVALVSGISEEIFFRGALQPQIGIIPTSILFAVMHVPSRKLWFYGLWALFAGLFLGNVYTRSHNLFVPIGIHILNNFISLWAWHLGRRGRLLPD